VPSPILNIIQKQIYKDISSSDNFNDPTFERFLYDDAMCEGYQHEGYGVVGCVIDKYEAVVLLECSACHSAHT